MEHPHVQRIDAFTTEPGRGNPAAVVTGTAGLDVAGMQRIAATLRAPATVFVLPPADPGHDLHLRFFTPAGEVAACAHATIAAHFALARDAGAPAVRRQLTGAGVQRVETRLSGTQLAVRLELGAPRFEPPVAPATMHALMEALGIGAGDLDFRCPVQVVGTGQGPGTLLLGLERRARLTALLPDHQRLAPLLEASGSDGCLVFTLETESDDDAHSHARMFSPGRGVEEDPVSGAGNGALGAYLVRHGMLPPLGARAAFRARQQAAGGRGGYVDVELVVREGEPAQVAIIGHAVVGTHVPVSPGG